jgi:hypothetical protein
LASGPNSSPLAHRQVQAPLRFLPRRSALSPIDKCKPRATDADSSHCRTRTCSCWRVSRTAFRWRPTGSPVVIVLSRPRRLRRRILLHAASVGHLPGGVRRPRAAAGRRRLLLRGSAVSFVSPAAMLAVGRVGLLLRGGALPCDGHSRRRVFRARGAGSTRWSSSLHGDTAAIRAHASDRPARSHCAHPTSVITSPLGMNWEGAPESQLRTNRGRRRMQPV